MTAPGFLSGVLAGALAGVVAPVFEGRILLPDGQPAAGAIVQVLGASGSATTDRDGRFVWVPTPSPPFHVLVVLPGDRYTEPVFIESIAAAAEIRVEILALVETVTVTSGAVPHTEATPGSAPAVIRGEAIRTRQAPRLTDVLEAVPGGGRSSDLHAGVPSLRGLSRGRTVMLLDGARVMTERRAGPSATFLDPFFLEAVEVVRGPSPVAYGSDAFGGVIHARTRRPAPGDPLDARFRGTLGAGIPEASLGAEVSGSAAGTGLLLQARRRSFSDYRSPDGVVAGSGARDAGFLARGVREVPGGTLATSVQVDAARDVGRPRRTSSVTSYPREDSGRFLADFQILPRWGFARLDAGLFFGSHRLVTRRESGNPLGSSVADSEVRARDFMLRAHGVRPLGEGRLELGVEALSRFGLESSTRLSGPGAAPLPVSPGDGSPFRSLLDGAHREEASFYAHAESPVARSLSGSGGFRLSGVATRPGASERRRVGSDGTDHAALSGFLALRADVASGASLTGQLSRGFRDPTLSDRYYTGLSGRGVIHGNPGLRPERSLQSDLSLRVDRSGARFGLHAYRYRIRDLIERFERGEDLFFFRNRGEALIRGLEFEMQVGGGPGRRLGLGVAASLTRGAAEDGSPLDGIPPPSVRAALRRRLRDRAFAEVVVHAFAADADPGPTETETDAWTRLDAAVGLPVGGGAELRFSGRNLLNAAYPISADARAVLAPGRTVVGSVVWTLGEAP